MKTVIHKAGDRGHANHGWLDAWHSFSFASYHDPAKVHFGALRVLNDDTIAAGMGFGTHPHDNMEIVTIPLSGDLEHNDSTGRNAIIRQGDVQIMSAGSGIQHSEINANKDKPLKLLQIWVFPKQRNIEPRYDQRSFPLEERLNRIQTVVAPDNEAAIWINQDAWFSLGSLQQGKALKYVLNRAESGVYAFLIEGEVNINGIKLNKRDALGISEVQELNIEAAADAEFLLIELPMQLN